MLFSFGVSASKPGDVPLVIQYILYEWYCGVGEFFSAGKRSELVEG